MTECYGDRAGTTGGTARSPPETELKGESEAARQLGAVFVRRYLVRTGAVPDADCAAFVEAIGRGLGPITARVEH